MLSEIAIPAAPVMLLIPPSLFFSALEGQMFKAAIAGGCQYE